MPALIGYGGHGRDILAIAQAAGVDLDVYDEDARIAPWPPHKIRGGIFLGVNNPCLRRALSERRGMRGAKPLIDPSARIGPDCELGRGVVIAPNVVLLRDVRLGLHTHVNYGSQMTRCAVGDFCTVAPGVTICGDVEIGDDCYVGAGATITNLVTIGRGVTIGAGAVVIDDVPDSAVVVGVPARPLGGE